MTERVAARRRRRPTDGSGNVPPALANWFANGCPAHQAPWHAVLPEERALLPERWAAWLAEHPEGAASPPPAWTMPGEVQP